MSSLESFGFFFFETLLEGKNEKKKKNGPSSAL
jgi:hypothetical protein